MFVCKKALASGPKSTRELALAVMASKDLDIEDKVLAKAVAAQLNASFAREDYPGRKKGNRFSLAVSRMTFYLERSENL